MRFTSSLSTFITTGLLATTAIAGVIPASGTHNRLGRREEFDEEDFIKVSEKLCGKDEIDDKRRSIFKREFVDLNKGKGAGPDTPLNTDGLSTCIGMVAVGTLKQDQTGNNHFLTHIGMGSRAGWDEFKAAYDADKDKLENVKGYITTPRDSLTKEKVKEMLEESDSEDEVDNAVSDEYVTEYTAWLNKQYDAWKAELQGLVGNISGEGHHDILEPGTMDSDGKGGVNVNGASIVPPPA